MFIMEQIAALLIEEIKKETATNPVTIFKHMVSKDYIPMHGPIHHVLDGACLLVAFKNAGGKLDLDEALNKLMKEGLRMPGAMCGLWCVCGAITSLGAALSIIDGTGPLTTDGTWGKHMDFTSKAVQEMGNINGPRCCKRDGLIAIKNAVEYVNANYPVHLEYEHSKCEHSPRNQQCIKERCPFYGGK